MEEQRRILRLLPLVVVVGTALEHRAQLVPDRLRFAPSHAGSIGRARRWFLRPSDQSRRATIGSDVFLRAPARQADISAHANGLEFHSMNDNEFFADVNL